MRQLKAVLFGGVMLAAFFGVSQGSLIDYANQLPECGLACTLENIPLSACRVVTNDTCICGDEGLRNSVQGCLVERCSRLDALKVARIEADACKRPIRNRKVDILVPLVVQIPGILIVPLRLYARWSTMHRFEADDWIMIFCGLLFVVFVVLGQLAGAVAFGEDVWMVSPEDLTFGLKIFFIDESFYLACLGLTKISVLFFYLRIFPNRDFRLATYATMALIVVSTTTLLFLQIFQCIPIDYNWLGWKEGGGGGGSNNPPPTPHRCLNMNAMALAAGGISIGHDVMILALPAPLLWRLHVSPRKKAGIFMMFGLGVFVLVTSCVRLRYLTLFTRSLNPTWDFTEPLVWSGVEVSVSMIVVCLPAMRVLFNRVLPEMFGWSVATSSSGSGSGSGSRSGVGGNGSGVSKGTLITSTASTSASTTMPPLKTSTGGSSSSGVGLSIDRGSSGLRNQGFVDDDELGGDGRDLIYGNAGRGRTAAAAAAAGGAVEMGGRSQKSSKVGGRGSFFSIFSFGGASRTEDRREDELELGDRIRGEVRTAVGHGGGGGDDYDDDDGVGESEAWRSSSMESGIHVRTTTTFS